MSSSGSESGSEVDYEEEMVLRIALERSKVEIGGNSGSGTEGPGVVLMLVMFVGMLAVFVPLLALQVRRLHDAGFSGFMTLIGMVPYVGWIAPLVMCCMDSKPEGVRYDNPDGTQPAVD